MTEENTETRGGKFKRYAKAAIKGSAKGAVKGLGASLMARGAITSGFATMNENSKEDLMVEDDNDPVFSKKWRSKSNHPSLRRLKGTTLGAFASSLLPKNRHVAGAGAVIGGLKGIRNEYKRSKQEKELTKEARSANVKKRVKGLSPESQRKYELSRGLSGHAYSSTGGNLSKIDPPTTNSNNTRKEEHAKLREGSGFPEGDQESFVKHMEKRRNFDFFNAGNESIENYFSDKRPVNEIDLDNSRKRKLVENQISEARQTSRGKGAGQAQHQRDNRRHSDKLWSETDSIMNKPKNVLSDGHERLMQKSKGGLGTAAKVGAGAAAAYGTYRVGKHLYNKYKQKKEQGMEKEAKSKNVASKLMEASRAASEAYHNSKKARTPKDYDPTTAIHEHHNQQYEKPKNFGKKPKIKSLDDFLNHTFY